MFGIPSKKHDVIREVVRTTQGGLHKRIDENRELLQLLQEKAPEFLAAHFWVESWLDSQDQFLTKLGETVKLGPSPIRPDYPRPWPGTRRSEQD